MKFVFKNFYSILLLAFVAMVSSCSVGNKVIPDPGGNIIVDTTGSLGSFNLIVTGDTSYVVNLLSDTSSAVGNFIVDDSLQVLGLGTNTSVLFTTFKSEVGTYYVETSPPGITGGIFVLQEKIGSVVKRYFMIHGKIIITENDTVNKIVKGSFDVNNEFATGSPKLFFLRANFVLRYQNK